MKKSLAYIVILAVLFSGCAGLTPTEQRVLTGGALGAAGGAIIGGAAGAPGTGAAIGAGAGVVGGFLSDQYEIRRRR
jgi:osmotically inducible lipoprotein OsmB